MGLLGKIADAVGKTVLAPVRFLDNVKDMAVSTLKMAGNVVTGDLEGAKKNLGELAQATKGAVFSGVESAFLIGGGVAALGAKASLGAAATSVGGKIVGTSAVKETAKGVAGIGGSFMMNYAENHPRN